MKQDIALVGLLPALVVTTTAIDGLWIGGCVGVKCLVSHLGKQYFTYYLVSRLRWG